MATNQSADAPTLRASVGEVVRRHRRLFLFEGILLTCLGIIAMLVPALASVAATIFFGWILLISGVAGLITTFRGCLFLGFGWSLLTA